MYQETMPLHGYTIDTSNPNNFSAGSTSTQVPVSGLYLLQDFRDANSDGPSMFQHTPTEQDNIITNNNAIVICANNSPVAMYLKKDYYVRTSQSVGCMLLTKVTSE